MRFSRYSFLSAAALPLSCGLIVFLLVPMLVRWQEPLPLKELSVMRRVHEMALAQHVLEHDPRELLHSAITGMVESLDPHSRYIPPTELERFQQEEIAGSYTGIGVVLARGIAPPTIEFRFLESPGRTAGLRVGDQILAVNGEDLSTLSADVAVGVAIERIAEAKQDLVQLSIRRDGQKPLDITVERGEVYKPSIKWAHFLDAEIGIAYLHLAEFKQRSVDEFDAAIARLQGESGRDVKALILDLRFNRGGLLNGAIQLANRFLEAGLIVSLKRRDGEIVATHEARAEECTLPMVPLVVLTNGSSASASEVLAAALQDHGRALIIGVRSFGKGVVQEIFGSTDPPFRLKLTTSHYYTPNGRSIERRMRREEDGADPGGVKPDRNVAVDRETRQQIEAGLARLEPPHDDLPAVEQLAKALGFAMPAPLSAAMDIQLEAAIKAAAALCNGAANMPNAKAK